MMYSPRVRQHCLCVGAFSLFFAAALASPALGDAASSDTAAEDTGCLWAQKNAAEAKDAHTRAMYEIVASLQCGKAAGLTAAVSAAPASAELPGAETSPGIPTNGPAAPVGGAAQVADPAPVLAMGPERRASPPAPQLPVALAQTRPDAGAPETHFPQPESAAASFRSFATVTLEQNRQVRAAGNARPADLLELSREGIAPAVSFQIVTHEELNPDSYLPLTIFGYSHYRCHKLGAEGRLRRTAAPRVVAQTLDRASAAD